MALVLEAIKIDTEDEKYDDAINKESTNGRIKRVSKLKNDNFNCLTNDEFSLENIQQMSISKCDNKNTVMKSYGKSHCITAQQVTSSNVKKQELKGDKRIERHIRTHNTCLICQKTFSSRESLRGHTKVHSSVRPFACTICCAAFKRKSHLNDHDKWVHKKKERPFSRKIAAWKAEVGKFSCDKCDEVFNNRYDFKRHTEVKHERKTCDVCNKDFSSSSSLYQHKILHKGTATSYLCDICGKVFNNKYFFKIHLKNHSNEKEFLCEVCGKCFVLKCYLKAHMTVHSESKSYACCYCDKTFHKKGNVIPHNCIHTGKKPYVCEICNRGFVQKMDRNKHKLTHKIKSNEE